MPQTDEACGRSCATSTRRPRRISAARQVCHKAADTERWRHPRSEIAADVRRLTDRAQVPIPFCVLQDERRFADRQELPGRVPWRGSWQSRTGPRDLHATTGRGAHRGAGGLRYRRDRAEGTRRRVRHRRPDVHPSAGNLDIEPECETGIFNLFLAGEYTRTNYRIPTMEKSCESGKRCAQALLAAFGFPTDDKRVPSSGCHSGCCARSSSTCSRGSSRSLQSPH